MWHYADRHRTGSVNTAIVLPAIRLMPEYSTYNIACIVFGPKAHGPDSFIPVIDDTARDY